MARKKKAAPRRTRKKKAARRAPVTMGSAYMERTPDGRIYSYNAADFEAPRMLWEELRAYKGSSVTADCPSGSFSGTLTHVGPDGVLVRVEGAVIALGLSSLALMVRTSDAQEAAATPGAFAAEPPTRGIPPEEDVF